MTSSGIKRLQELARTDAGLADESNELRARDAAVADIRERAEAIAEFFAGHAEQDAELQKAEARESAVVDTRRSELDTARLELERATSDEARTLAEKRLARATDHLELAEQALERAHADRRAFDEAAERLTRELPLLEEQASALGSTGNDLVEWASTKHAELFVAVGQLDAQRERVIREANELATALLGEPTFGSTPAQALERVERYSKSSWVG